MLSAQKNSESLNIELCVWAVQWDRRQEIAILKICTYVLLIKTINKMAFSTSIEKIREKELIFPLILIRCR